MENEQVKTTVSKGNTAKIKTKTVCDLAYYFKIEVNALYKKMLDYQKKNGVIIDDR